ncbi:MAG: hypothetical protein IJ429_00460 [Lachnospiraceae bacterium]|nr:hypothetical protein [Lachnospiraceae bacterium]
MDLQAMLNALLLLEHNGRTIDKFFEDNDVKHIALYGMGLLGCRVYEHLCETEVDVLCAFDRDADRFCEENDIKILPPDEMLSLEKKPELIVVTSSNFYYDIKEEWEEKSGIDMISISEILEYCIVGEDLERVKRK